MEYGLECHLYWTKNAFTYITYCSGFRYDKGGYLFLPSCVMRTHGSRQQQDAIRTCSPKQMQKVYEV